LPAKVAVFASGLMGMINGTSAGNVVATGSLTIPLMKRVGYRGRSAAAIEAAASTGGQLMPPIMGAGAFIMAEVTGIPYTEIIIAALIPAVLYFLSVYFMVDLEAAKLGMKGLPQRELPVLRQLLKQVFLFIPIVMLIGALFLGYSVIRAGTLALISAVVVSWLTAHRMGPKSIIDALHRGLLDLKEVIGRLGDCSAASVSGQNGKVPSLGKGPQALMGAGPMDTGSGEDNRRPGSDDRLGRPPDIGRVGGHTVGRNTVLVAIRSRRLGRFDRRLDDVFGEIDEHRPRPTGHRGPERPPGDVLGLAGVLAVADDCGDHPPPLAVHLLVEFLQVMRPAHLKLNQKLVTDRAEEPLDLPAALRAARGGVDQLDAELGADPAA
jgi:hypothetical protein